MNINELKDQLAAVEQQYPNSNLVTYAPKDEHEHFFNALCRAYLAASIRERQQIRDAVKDMKGVLNCLLGYVYQSAEQVRTTRDRQWLQIGLAAAAMEQDGYDPRDSLLALAELYVIAEEAGLDSKAEFEAIGEGIPADFDTYAVVRSRRERPG